MLILASASPRRRELMTMAGLEFQCDVADVDETLPDDILPDTAVQMLSLKKASAVADSHRDDTVVGSDTLVVLDGEILGKPADENDAKNMLCRLSGRTHTVYTGVAIVCGNRKRSFYSKTDVTFFELSQSEIDNYVATGEPMDKAGAYGIQGLGCRLVERINGDFYTVMGLPIARLLRELDE